MSDGDHCPITRGVGLLQPIGSPKAGPGLQQVWLRGDRSCSLSLEVASVEALATTCGGGEEVSDRGTAHLPLPVAGRSGWACAGAAAGEAYVRVVRAKAARASRVTAGGDSSGRCATGVAPPIPSPSRGGRSARVGPRLRSHVPGASSPPARRPASIPPVRAQPGLVHPAPLAAGGGLIPALGPILQMEKLTHGARKCLALGPRGRVRTQVCQNEEPSFPHHIGSCSLLRKPVACKARVFRVPGVSRRTLLVTLWSILGST